MTEQKGQPGRFKFSVMPSARRPAPPSDYERAMGALAGIVSTQAGRAGMTPAEYVALRRESGRGFAFDVDTEPGSFLRYEGWEPEAEDWDRLAAMAAELS